MSSTEESASAVENDDAAINTEDVASREATDETKITQLANDVSTANLELMFHNFPELPLEIRQKIWRATFPAERRFKILVLNDFYFCYSGPSRQCDESFNLTIPPPPIAALVNVDSRTETLRHYLRIPIQGDKNTGPFEGTLRHDPEKDQQTTAVLLWNMKIDIMSISGEHVKLPSFSERALNGFRTPVPTLFLEECVIETVKRLEVDCRQRIIVETLHEYMLKSSKDPTSFELPFNQFKALEEVVFIFNSQDDDGGIPQADMGYYSKMHTVAAMKELASLHCTFEWKPRSPRPPSISTEDELGDGSDETDSDD